MTCSYTKETHIHLNVKLIGRTQLFLEKSVLGTSKNCVIETVRPQQLGAGFVYFICCFEEGRTCVVVGNVRLGIEGLQFQYPWEALCLPLSHTY